MPQPDRLERIQALAALTGQRHLVAGIEWLALSKNGDKWLGNLERSLAYEAIARGIEPHPFLPGPAPEEVCQGELLIGTLDDGAAVRMPVEELATHLFVAGTTGSGKTFFLAFLAAQLMSLEQEQ